MSQPTQPGAAEGRTWGIAAGAISLGLLAGLGTSVGAFHYGWSLFLLTPLVVGMGAAWIPRGPEPRLWACVKASISLNAVLCLLFLLIGLEGLICLVMATPLVALMGAIGGLLGGLMRRRWERPAPDAFMLVAISLPLLLAWERPAITAGETLSVSTEVIVRATPQSVWHETVEFAPITAPPAGILRLGIAYPTHAILRKDGDAYVRECHFTTGPFIEPVTSWMPPTHLAFDVAAQPPSMRELSPWPIHPPHLDGMVRSRRGEFRIEALEDGTTRLRGTTWYTIEAAPQAYWRMWSDAIIHRIHHRVLDHIAQRAENADAGRGVIQVLGQARP